MKQKLHFLVALAVMAIAFTPTASADLALTLTTGLGATASGVACTAGICYNGAVGDWTINVSTGLEGFVYALDLNSVDASGTGTDSLTLDLTTTDNKAIGSVDWGIGGTISSGMSLTYRILVNGSPVTTATFFPDSFSGHGSGCCKALNDTLTQEVVLTRTGKSSASFDAHVDVVPDGGVTLMLLGGVLVGLETLRRRLRA
jgi:hypothetical protein